MHFELHTLVDEHLLLDTLASQAGVLLLEDLSGTVHPAAGDVCLMIKKEESQCFPPGNRNFIPVFHSSVAMLFFRAYRAA